MGEQPTRLPFVGGEAASLKAETTQGPINFPLTISKERSEPPAADTKILDWFMVLKKCPK